MLVKGYVRIDSIESGKEYVLYEIPIKDAPSCIPIKTGTKKIKNGRTTRRTEGGKIVITSVRIRLQRNRE